VRNYRTGLLEVTRFAHDDVLCYSESVADAWPLELEGFDQFSEALPVVAAPLTSAVQLSVEHSRYLMPEAVNAPVVAPNTIVVVVPAHLRVERCEQFVLRHPAVFAHPLLEARQGGAVLTTGGTTFEHWT